MLRAFHEPGFSGETFITLSATESRHLVSVRRARIGESVEILDGRGGIATGSLRRADPRAASVTIASTRSLDPPSTRTVIACALTKGKGFDEMLLHAAELGVTAVEPLLTAHSEVRLDRARARKRHDRWHQLAVEAAKQSGNPWLLEIPPARRFDAWIDETGRDGALNLIAVLHRETVPLSEALESRSEPGTIRLLIGPEGDFRDDECDTALGSGFLPVSLGPWTLRTETAALAGAARITARFRGR